VSPRRRIDPAAGELFGPAPPPRHPRPWRFIVISALSALLIAGAIAGSTLIMLSHEAQHRETINDVSVLGYVRSFMTAYTSPDPFHANDYTDKVMAQATGDFAKGFKQKENEIAVQVALAQPTQGTVLDAGVERWNGDGSATVLVATKITSTSPDGKNEIESGNRWVVTVSKEGQRWKISQLMQVI
jgi:Mce-associated membrane protein